GAGGGGHGVGGVVEGGEGRAGGGDGEFVFAPGEAAVYRDGVADAVGPVVGLGGDALDAPGGDEVGGVRGAGGDGRLVVGEALRGREHVDAARGLDELRERGRAEGEEADEAGRGFHGVSPLEARGR